MTTSNSAGSELTDARGVDARGVEIGPGDTCVYGFGVSQSVAMAEGIILGEEGEVSTTKSGRIRVRVVRRSYGGGEKPVVDIAPDRLVVLKPGHVAVGGWPYLPPSPLPTQDEALRERIENLIETYTADLRATEVPHWAHSDGWTLVDFHAWCARQLTGLRKDLRELDERGEA